MSMSISALTVKAEEKRGEEEIDKVFRRLKSGETAFEDAIRRYPNSSIVHSELLTALDSPEAKEKLLTQPTKKGFNILELALDTLRKRKYNGHDASFCELIDKMIEVNDELRTPTHYDIPLLQVAIQSGLSKKTIAALCKHFDIMETDEKTTHSALEVAYYLDDLDYPHRKDIILLLVKKGANPTRLYKEAVDDIIQLSLLHAVAKKGDYQLFKQLVGYNPPQSFFRNGIDINLPDSRGRTPLHYAAENGHFNIVYFLLRLSGISATQVDDDGKTPTDCCSDIHIRRLIENHCKQQAEIKKDKVHWVRSLDFSYHRNSSKGRSITVSGNEQHLFLMGKEVVSRPGENKKKDRQKTSNKAHNHATASVTFIFTSADNDEDISEYSITIDDKYSHVKEMFPNYPTDYIEHLKNLKLPQKKFKVNKQQELESHPTSDLSSDDKNAVTINTLFVHSEQAVFKAITIQEVVDNIVLKLKESVPGFNEGKYKVVGVILNIHTERYMCQNCQCTAVYSEQVAKFKEMLKGALEENGFSYKTKSNLPLATVVSAAQPFGTGKMTKQHKMQVADHMDMEVDLRTVPDGHLFLTDLSVTGSKGLPFMSGFKEELFKLKSQLQESKEKCDQRDTENAELKAKNTELEAEIRRLKETNANQSKNALYDDITASAMDLSDSESSDSKSSSVAREQGLSQHSAPSQAQLTAQAHQQAFSSGKPKESKKRKATTSLDKSTQKGDYGVSSPSSKELRS